MSREHDKRPRQATYATQKGATRSPSDPKGKYGPRKTPIKRAVRAIIHYWVLVRCKSGQENYARLNLEKQGYEVYYPRCMPTGKGKLEPVFRTYIFAKVEHQWSSIENTFGVIGILKHGEIPQRVVPEVIDDLKARENADGVVVLPHQRTLTTGDHVEILRGAFKGHVMVYDGDTDDGRVRALYDFMGKPLAINYHRGHVAALDDNRVPPGAVASKVINSEE